MRKSVALLLVLVLAISSIVSVLSAKAEYNGSITINADGSVNPPTPLLKQSGDVYSLTNDIVTPITVNKSNIMLDGHNHRLTGLSIFNYGITLNDTSNVTVANFYIIGGAKGIDVTGTSNIIANNTISGTDNGIYSIQDPTAAISLNDASSNLVTGNNLKNNTVGIGLVSWHPKQCTNNLIVENNFTECSTAISFYDSSNNSVYHNNFINNNILLSDIGYYAYSLPSFNIWDDGHLFGNYYSDYQIRYPNATEMDSTGVGDTPYFVKPRNYVDPATLSRQEAEDYWTNINAQYAKNTDHYPLVYPYDIENDAIAFPLRISIISPVHEIYNESNVSLNFTVNKPTNWTGYSLDGKQNVTIAGNTTITGLSNGLHNLEVYANDTFGNMGSSTVTFTLAVPFPTTIVIASVVTVAIIAIMLLVYFKKRKH